MARARNIKPGFFKNEHLSDMSPHARLLFIGLWCLADKAGRLEDRPRQIKVEIFPYEDVDVSNLLDCLMEEGFIVRYQVNYESYIQVVNFEKHQHPHHKEAESVIPAADISNIRDLPMFTSSIKQARVMHKLSMNHPSRISPSDSLQSDSLQSENPKPGQPVDNFSGKTSGEKKGGSFDKSKMGNGDFNIMHTLDDRGIAAAKEAVDGWDIYHLAAIYNENINTGKMDRPKFPNKAFPGWCKSYTKGKKP